MAMVSLSSRLSPLAAALLLATTSAAWSAAPRTAASKRTEPATRAESAAETVDLFAAIKSEQIEVKFIAKNANESNLIVENKTKRPLTVRLPDAFAAMPVLAQPGAAPAGGGGGGDANQGVGQGGAAFNVPPEKTKHVKLASLCLEHGKPDPTPRTLYELRPIEALTDKPEVVEIVKQHSAGALPTKIAQAAAWHLQNGVSWQELAAKRIKHLGGTPDEPVYSRQELAAAAKVVELAKARVKDRPPQSPGSDSLSPVPVTAEK